MLGFYPNCDLDKGVLVLSSDGKPKIIGAMNVHFPVESPASSLDERGVE